MVQRCTNPKRSSYRHYGERGITVCARWLKFENFLADMGPRPDGLTLERKDNNKGYYKSNCEWASAKRQNRNSRQTRMVQIGSKTKALSDWCELYCISINTVRCRVKKHGWTYVDAITKPVQKVPFK